MKAELLLYAALPLLAQAAETVGGGRYCAYGCRVFANEWYYPTVKGLTYSNKLIAIPQKAGTAAICIEHYCGNSTSSWQKILDLSELPKSSPYYIANQDYWTVLANATKYVQPWPSNATAVVYAPIYATPEQIKSILRTGSAWEYTAVFWPNVFSGLLVGLMFLTFALAMMRAGWLQKRSHRSLSVTKSSPIAVYTKKWLLMPAICHDNAHRPSLFGFTFSLPTRLQSVIVFLFICVNIIGCGVGMDIFMPNVWWTSNKIQTTRFLADRTGYYAIYNMVLLMVFAGRNMPLIWLTGSTFATFNVYHRWIGRVIIVEAILHSILYIVTYPYMNHEYYVPYLAWGLVATLFGSLMVPTATHAARKWSYELFLASHIILAVFFFVGAWYHIYLLDYRLTAKWSESYLSWILAASILWAGDRFIRVLRLLWRNVNYTSSGLVFSKASLKMVQGDLIKMDIKLARDFHFSPGHYVFIHIGKAHRFLQSHPFTIVNYEEPSAASSAGGDSNKESSSIQTTPFDGKVLTLLLRPHKGITRHLKTLAINEPDTLRNVLVEGPYGHALPLHNYDNLTFVSGGIGFTSIMPQVKQAVREAHNRLHWIIICRTVEELVSYQPWILQVADAPNLVISIRVTDPESKMEKEAISDLQLEIEALGQGRPDVPAMIRSDADTAGSMAVVTCGPGGLLDDCRATCVKLVSTRRANLEFFSEMFEW